MRYSLAGLSNPSSGRFLDDAKSITATAIATTPRRMKIYSAWIAADTSWTWFPASVISLVKIFPM